MSLLIAGGESSLHHTVLHFCVLCGKIENTLEVRGFLLGLARRLEHQHPGAAASLREGLEETLTVMRLGLPENLERVLSS